MTEADYFLQEHHEKKPATLTLVDWLTTFFLPVFAIAAAVFVGWNGKQPRVLWGFIAVAAISLLVGPFQWFWYAFRRWLNRIKDQRAARHYSPLLQEQVARFGQFVGGTSDTLHYICYNTLCGGDGMKQAKLLMPDLAAWSGRCGILSRRLAGQNPDVKELQLDILEFHDLVGTYINLCANAVFDRLAQDLRAAMTPRAKADLAAFQQRFHGFQSDSERLIKEIVFSRPCFNGIPFSFAPVKPLA
jgi:hypothetical protein